MGTNGVGVRLPCLVLNYMKLPNGLGSGNFFFVEFPGFGYDYGNAFGDYLLHNNHTTNATRGNLLLGNGHGYGFANAAFGRGLYPHPLILW